jgi:hypothetical protein
MNHKKSLLCVGLLWLFGALVALFAPLDILTSAGLLDEFCEFAFLSANICDLHSKKSSFPEVAAVYSFFSWLAFPFWIVIWWIWMSGQIGGKTGGVIFKYELSVANKIFLIGLLPIWIFLFYAVVFLYAGGDSRLFNLGSSRVHLALFGMVVPASSAGLLSLVIFTIKRVFLRGF